MKAFTLPAALLLAAAAFTSQAQPDLSAPVTRDEVKASFARVEKVMAARLDVKIAASALKGAEPATRAEVMAEMIRVLDVVQNKFKFTPRPYKVYEDVISKPNSGQALVHARRLIRLGLAGPVGPLVAGGAGLTTEQFGDALGLFFVQIASYTHTPLPKWTPAIQKP